MQGFNMGRYRPPSSLDPSLSALSEDPRRQPKWQRPAQPTVRFEMPVAIWCASCPEHSTSKLIAQGVRFNATKKRVGNYFSTPVFAFRIKHIPCGSWIEIRNDPKRAREAKEGKADMHEAWVVSEGAKKRDYGTEKATVDGESVVLWEPRDPHGGLSEERFQEREKVLADFENKKQMKTNNVDRIAELKADREKYGRDPDAWNRKLRAQFRGNTKYAGEKREEEKRKAGELKWHASKRVKTEKFEQMVKHNTRERMLGDVWSSKTNDQAISGLAVKPVRRKSTSISMDENRARDNRLSDRKTIGYNSADSSLVKYDDDDW